MQSKRVCIFIDGENLRHSIVDLFGNDFDQRDYLPKSATWGSLFDHIMFQACAESDCELVRVYWYTVSHIDFYPLFLPKNKKDEEKLGRLVCKKSQDLERKAQTQGIKAVVEELRARKESMRKRFEGWKYLHGKIEANNKAVEFRRAGAIRYDLFERKLGKEKAVDVKLAVDMVLLRDIYDVGIIVSGDQDYVPAVEAMKDFGKRIINVAFKTRSDKLLPGGAKRLNQKTDWSVSISFEKMKEFLLK